MSQSLVSATSSSSEGEDFSSRSSPARRKRKITGQSGGGDSRPKRSKKEKKSVQLRLAKGVKLKSHFKEGGWCDGEIKGPSKIRGKDFQVRYSDREVWDFSKAELSDGWKHKVIG